MSSFRRAIARPARPHTLSTFPAATVALVLLTPLLTRLPPRRLARILSLIGPRSARITEAAARDALARVERALGVAARVQNQRCLTRGVSRFMVLRRAGLPVELVFGLGPSDGGFAGHCWLELDGAPYLEREDPRGSFPEMLRIPTDAHHG